MCILGNLISFVLLLPWFWWSVSFDVKASKATVAYHLQVYLHFFIPPGRLKMSVKKLVWKSNKPHFYLWHPGFAAEYLMSLELAFPLNLISVLVLTNNNCMDTVVLSYIKELTFQNKSLELFPV